MIQIAIPIVLAIALLIEGLGTPNGRDAALILMLLIPIILLIHLRSKPKLFFPAKITKLWLLFLAFTLISTLFSQDFFNSLKFTLLYISSFAAFIFAYNYKEFLVKWIIKTIFAFSFIFCAYSLITNSYLLTPPSHGYQFVFSRFGSHNHLGDFLLLPLIICIYYLFNKQKSFLVSSIYFLVTLFFLPYFLFSYSRSAYLSLIITLIVMLFMLFKNKVKLISAKTLIGISIIAITSIFFASMYFYHANQTNLLSRLNNKLVQHHNLTEKTWFGGRPEYLREAIISMTTYPILGVGPGNFVLISKEYNAIEGLWTESAHNIFVEIIAENGILTGFLFIYLIYELFRKTNKNIYFFLLLSLLLNFQTDYTYRIFTFFILFFVIAGINLSKKT